MVERTFVSGARETENWQKALENWLNLSLENMERSIRNSFAMPNGYINSHFKEAGSKNFEGTDGHNL